MGQVASVPLDLHGLLLVGPIPDPVLSAGADAQDHIDVVHPGTLHLLGILAPSGICANPVRAKSCLMIVIMTAKSKEKTTPTWHQLDEKPRSIPRCPGMMPTFMRSSS